MAPSLVRTTTFVLALACLLVDLSRPASAVINCGQVVSLLAPCIPYARSPGQGPAPGPCCSGIRSLNAVANTTPDRQTTCRCLKSLAGSNTGFNSGAVAGLPGKCGVNVGYPISTTTDCTKVH